MEHTCKQCGNIAHLALESRIPTESRVGWKLYPKGDNLLSAETIGGSLVHLSKLFKSLARSHGTHVSVAVEGMSRDEAGAVQFDLLILEIAKPRRKTAKATLHA